MSSQDPKANALRPERARMQFSLRAMFVLTAVVAFACAVLFALPNVVAVPLLLATAVALPAVLTTLVVYGSGYLRTFCIGALFPAATVLYTTGWVLAYNLLFRGDTYVDWAVMAAEDAARLCRWYAGTSWVLGLVVGLMCVGARWLVERKTPR